jgi:hypothetical protein
MLESTELERLRPQQGRNDTSYRSREWKDGFKKLGEIMNIRVDQLVIEDGVSIF